MKTLLLTCTLALATGLTPVEAQIFGPNLAPATTVLGAVAGALIGGHNGRPLQGAAIGAGAGLLLGAALDQAAPRQTVYAAPPTYYSQPAPVTVVGEAPLAPMAPVYGATPPAQPVVVYQAQPQVVYVSPAPVIYAAPPPVVYSYPPVWSGWGWGPYAPGLRVNIGVGWGGGYGYRSHGWDGSRGRDWGRGRGHWR